MKIRFNSLFTLLIIALITVYSGSVFAQTEKTSEVKTGDEEWSIEIDPTSKARINFIEDSWDFGSIPKDAIITHDFDFYNSGDDTLVITKVQPTCGCTTAPLKSDRIAPGDTSGFSVKVNTKKLHGLVRKFINVECSDPINPYLRLIFKAVINDPNQKIMVNPLVADFTNIKKGSNSSVDLEITNTYTETANLMILDKPKDKMLSIDLKSKTLKPGESTTISFNFDGDTNSGEFFGSMTLEAEGMAKSRFTIPIKGTVVE